jgi:lipid II:glycine glycyltransferase (peptidoglycan interpeptide bridge formation enzyme)
VELLNEKSLENLWDSSRDATAFTQFGVLSSLAFRSEWWGVYKGTTLIAAWPIALSKTNSVYIPEFCYYVGPIWNESHTERPESSKFSERINVYNLYISHFLKLYKNLIFELPPTQQDVRAFLWWNYQAQGHIFRIEPRYSAIISNIQARSDVELLSSFRELRRREIRKISTNPKFEIFSKFDFDKLSKLYWKVLGLQNISRNKETEDSLKRVINLSEKSDLKFLVFTNENSDEMLGVIVLLIAKNTANLILNLFEPSVRNSGLPSWAIYKAILSCKILGVDNFDFNGANSPNRGDDKHSYGAKEILYFRLSYD